MARRYRAGITALVLLVTCSISALAQLPPRARFTAATVTLQPDGRIVLISGHLVDDVATHLEKILAAAPGVRTVRLDSYGGNVKVAIDINLLITAKGLTTEVLGNCVSACAIAFLGGKQRVAGAAARFGFHGASVYPEIPDPQSRLEISNLVIRGMYLHAGVTKEFVDWVLALPYEPAWWPSHAELRQAGFLPR